MQRRLGFCDKKVDMVFNGSDEDAICGLEEDLRENWHVVVMSFVFPSCFEVFFGVLVFFSMV